MIDNRKMISTLAVATVVASIGAAAHASGEMSRGDSAATRNGWKTISTFTIGDSIGGYTPPGIPDGMAAFPLNKGTVRVLCNHELTAGAGYSYTVTGVSLRGARVSYFDIDVDSLQVLGAGLAYSAIYDRSGVIVTAASQVNEAGHATNGFDRFCSAQGVQAGEYGFVDDVYFTNEETGTPTHPHGGSVWALDVDTGAIWGVPALGRGAWENVAAFDSGSPNHIALLLGDDTAPAPLYLFIGQRNGAGDGSFLDRNGLKVGQLYAWAADNGDTTPQQFNASNGGALLRTGSFEPIAVRDIAQAGMPGYDSQGYLNDSTLRAAASAAGAFQFSRPEDLHTNPDDGSQLVFVSTGRGQLYPADNWGDVYITDMDLSTLTSPMATVTILHDADALPIPDQGVRSPDNLCWAADGFIYVQEDKSTSPASLFGGVTGIEASIWKLNPVSGEFARVNEMDRSAVPAGQSDGAPADLGNWETSGIIDVSHLFRTTGGETLLLANVQAHSLTNGPIGGSTNLVQGGQLFFITNVNRTCAGDVDGNGAVDVDDLIAVILGWGACP